MSDHKSDKIDMKKTRKNKEKRVKSLTKEMNLIYNVFLQVVSCSHMTLSRIKFESVGHHIASLLYSLQYVPFYKIIKGGLMQ